MFQSFACSWRYILQTNVSIPSADEKLVRGWVNDLCDRDVYQNIYIGYRTLLHGNPTACNNKCWKLKLPKQMWPGWHNSTSMLYKMSPAFHLSRISTLYHYSWAQRHAVRKEISLPVLHPSQLCSITVLHCFDAVGIADLLHTDWVLCRSRLSYHGSWTSRCAVPLY